MAEAKTLEIRAQIEAKKEENKKLLNESEEKGISMIAFIHGRYSNAVSSADAEYDQKVNLAEVIRTEGTNVSISLAKQCEAIASAGGEAQIALAFATNIVGKKTIMIPSGNAVNLQTLDLNKALESLLRK